MSNSFSDCAALVGNLHTALRDLESVSQPLQLDPLASREWFQLLEQKLLPQLSDSAFLVAAVVGGTNIGKSVLFNHLAGTRASATSPLASGTKHPVCLIPRGFELSHDLTAIFPGFELRDWTDADAALEELDQDVLFWRHSDALPPNLIVLDTPDIDSDARINWERADKIRRAADVLVAVLTQQKYNDAAVKEFFRRAAAEDKFVLAVFNQVHLPDDHEYWPLWMNTFCTETGIDPEFLYLAPHNRKAAEDNSLEFLECRWPDGTVVSDITHDRRRLNEDLSGLKFGEIKLRTMRGSLDVISRPDGVRSFLDEVRDRSAEYFTAAELLSTHKLAEIEGWPTIPNGIIVQQIRNWWQNQREGWSAAVHNFYNRLGTGIMSGFKFLRTQVSGPPTPPIDEYRAREWAAILDTIDDVYSRLNWFKELGNPLLQPRLTELLGAISREELLEAVRAAHTEIDLEAQLAELVANEFEVFREESPTFYKSLRQLDSIAAAVRPATSIVLFVTGFGPVGSAVGHLATETAVSSAVSVAGDVAAGSVTAAVGETWISNTTSTGAALLEAHFRKIHEQFTQARAAWLAELLHEHLLGTLPEDLQTAAALPRCDAFQIVDQTLQELSSQFAPESSPLVEGNPTEGVA